MRSAPELLGKAGNYLNWRDDDSFRFCTEVLHGAGVAITPGRDFGDINAHRYVRFTYTIGIPQLTEVVARLAAFLKR